MKKGIHPEYFKDAKVVCACGNTFTIGSTASEIHIEVCSKCHPFFTGEMKYVDTLGRVEKFQKRQEKAKKLHTTKIKEKEEKQKAERPDSLRGMLDLIKKQAAS